MTPGKDLTSDARSRPSQSPRTPLRRRFWHLSRIRIWSRIRPEYILGPDSLGRIAPQVAGAKPGFEEGAEAHHGVPRRRRTRQAGAVLLPQPGNGADPCGCLQSRSWSAGEAIGGTGSVVLPGATERQADAILGQVEYEAKITWNEAAASLIRCRCLYQLLVNIIALCMLLLALCLTAGVIYGMMRLYRRRFGTLEEDEAMTTLHLTGPASNALHANPLGQDCFSTGGQTFVSALTQKTGRPINGLSWRV